MRSSSVLTGASMSHWVKLRYTFCTSGQNVKTPNSSRFGRVGHVLRANPVCGDGARMALAITGAGGLAMLAGFILLGEMVGSYELTQVLATGDNVTINMDAGTITWYDASDGSNDSIIAAMSAEGTSTIHNIEQIDRGYQNIDKRLNALGADIQRI